MAATSFSLEFCFMPLWQLFHAIFHSSWHLFQPNFHVFMAGTSFSPVFCLISLWQLFMQYFIPPGIYFNQIFISLQQLLHSLLILSHFPLAAISCNISFLLAFISIIFSFFHGSYFTFSWTLSHFLPAAISCDISFLLAFIFISSWQLLHSLLDFVSFPSGSYFM